MIIARLTEYLIDTREKESEEIIRKIYEKYGKKRVTKKVVDDFVWLTCQEGINTEYTDIFA